MLVWPDVEGRLLRLLRRRGASAATAEDLVQEVAVRALRTCPAFESADQLFWWSSTVGRRLLIDDYRKTSRSVPVADVPDGRVAEDPAGQVEREDAVRAVLTEFSLLPASQQQAFRRRATRGGSSTDYVRRHRARARLRAAMEALGAWWLWLQHRGSAAPDGGERGVSVGVGVGAVTLVASGIAVVGLGVGGGVGTSVTPQVQSAAAAVSPHAFQWSGGEEIGDVGTDQASSPAAQPEGVTIDPPVTVEVEHDVPNRGSTGAAVDRRDDEPPVVCVDLASAGLARCVEYPIRPD